MQSREEIAAGTAISIRAAQKLHGHALSMLEKEIEGDTDYGKEII